MSPPAHERDLTKNSSKLATDSSYSVRPAEKRSRVKSVFLVLSCAGSMIINVGGLAMVCAVIDFLSRLDRRPQMPLRFLSPFLPSERIWGSTKISCNGSSLLTLSLRCVHLVLEFFILIRFHVD